MSNFSKRVTFGHEEMEISFENDRSSKSALHGLVHVSHSLNRIHSLSPRDTNFGPLVASRSIQQSRDHGEWSCARFDSGNNDATRK
jgi:hypothetical protein